MIPTQTDTLRDDMSYIDTEEFEPDEDALLPDIDEEATASQFALPVESTHADVHDDEIYYGDSSNSGGLPMTLAEHARMYPDGGDDVPSRDETSEFLTTREPALMYCL